MRLFAPKNDWGMASGGGWWPLLGSVTTTSGVRVGPETALGFAPIFAGVRVISEGLAGLPLAVIEQRDSRTSEKATGHPLWPVLHDAPTPEQDIVSWLDMQTAFQVMWGNAFAEIQRNSVGEIVALWPIHPSRLPNCNIRRNPVDPAHWQEIVAGKPGELVYYVRGDDGIVYALAAGDVLHIPGVSINSDGISGRGVISYAPNAVGVAMATEHHAGAFFRNGAVSNVAIKSTKVVGKEVAERLREQWQKTFGGVHNHYKTLLLEDGMEPVPFSVDPEKSQMMLARNFGVSDSARLLKVPPHMIGDLSRATNSNIEQQSLEFVIHTMLPWVVRWEKAMFRQLLTKAEKKRYYFKFNMMGLLRGDQAARGEFYQRMFNLGAFSPNDIREREDMNPIPDGDQYFVQGNNAVPLDKVADLSQSQIDKNRQKPEKVEAVPPAAGTTPEKDEPEDRLRLAELRDELIAEVELRNTALLESQSSGVKSVAHRIGECQHQVADVIRVEVAGSQAELRDALETHDTRQTMVIAAMQHRLKELNEHDTQSAERLAVREHELQKAEAEVRDALRDSIAARLVGLTQYEARAIREAAAKPQFLNWQERFYAEFATKLDDALLPFETAADRLGFTFSAAALASDYVSDSTTSLAPLADVPVSELEPQADATVATWTDRPARLAKFIIPERTDSCAA